MIDVKARSKKKFKKVVLSKRPDRLFIIAQYINCAHAQNRAMRLRRTKNRLMGEIGLKVRIDEGKGAQACINDGLGAYQ